MRIYFLLTLLFAIRLTAAGQTSINLILKSGFKVDSVSIADISSQEFHKMAYKDTLTFKFKKNNIDLYTIKYFIKQNSYWKQIWLDTGNINVKAHLADKSTLIVDTVINSPVYYGVAGYHKTLLKLKNDTTARKNFMLGEIAKNLENTRSFAIAYDYISFNQNSKPDLLKLKQLLSRQKTDFSWFFLYSIVIERMNNILEIKSIDLSQFQFVNRNKKCVNINLGNYQLTLIDFWFVGCTACMEQHKELKLNIQKLTRNHVNVIGISIVGKFDPWNSYLSQHGYNWDNYLQSGTNTLSNYLSLYAFPAYVLLNKKGEIIKTYSSINDVLNGLRLNYFIKDL